MNLLWLFNLLTMYLISNKDFIQRIYWCSKTRLLSYQISVAYFVQYKSILIKYFLDQHQEVTLITIPTGFQLKVMLKLLLKWTNNLRSLTRLMKSNIFFSNINKLKLSQRLYTVFNLVILWEFTMTKRIFTFSSTKLFL